MSEVYQFITEQKKDYPVQALCKALGANRSSYYEYQSGETYATRKAEHEIMRQVQELFTLHRRRYGSRRMSKALQQKGVPIGRFKIRRLMRDQSLKAIHPKSFVPKTTNSKHKLGYAPNVLATIDFPSQPNQAYVGDITYLPTPSGWLYLNVWIDLFSRLVVGWKIDTHMAESLVVDSLKQAVHKRGPQEGLVIHSDRGGQYAGTAFKEVIKKHQCIQSMSGADNPYDNAFAESFFSRLKAELLEKGVFENIEDATTEVFNYIEMYYNTHRLHSGLEYLSPAQYEELFNQKEGHLDEAERNALVKC